MKNEKFQFLNYNIEICFSLFIESLEGQIQEIIEEKASLNNEYQKEQNDLLVLYSTYLIHYKKKSVY
jgi:hypothetical protein